MDDRRKTKALGDEPLNFHGTRVGLSHAIDDPVIGPFTWSQLPPSLRKTKTIVRIRTIPSI